MSDFYKYVEELRRSVLAEDTEQERNVENNDGFDLLGSLGGLANRFIIEPVKKNIIEPIKVNVSAGLLLFLRPDFAEVLTEAQHQENDREVRPKAAVDVKKINELKGVIQDENKGEDIKDEDKIYIALIAICSNKTDYALDFINRNSLINSKNNYGVTPLHMLVYCIAYETNVDNKQKLYNLLEEFLSKNADISATDNIDSITPFHIACKSGDFELVELLMKHSSHEGEESSNGDLYNENLAKALATGDSNGVSPLMIILERFERTYSSIMDKIGNELSSDLKKKLEKIHNLEDNFDVAGCLLEIKNQFSEQKDVLNSLNILESQVKILNSMFNCDKLNLNLCFNKAPTPLTKVIGDRNVGLVKKLVEKGADINLQDGYKRTPLLCAINDDNEKSPAIFFRENPVFSEVPNSVDIKQKLSSLGMKRYDELYSKVQNADVDEMKKILNVLMNEWPEVRSIHLTDGTIIEKDGDNFKIGSDILDEQTLGQFQTDGWKSNYNQIIEYLLDQERIEVNKVGYRQQVTPLILSCMRNRAEVVELLCNRTDIEVNKYDGKGRTALDYAKENFLFFDSDIIPTLKNKGAESSPPHIYDIIQYTSHLIGCSTTRNDVPNSNIEKPSSDKVNKGTERSPS